MNIIDIYEDSHIKIFSTEEGTYLIQRKGENKKVSLILIMEDMVEISGPLGLYLPVKDK